MKYPLVLSLLMANSLGLANPIKKEDCDTNKIVPQTKDLAMVMNNLKTGCADAAKLGNICGYVYIKLEAPEESPFEYLYEQRIFDAACADPVKDSEEVIQKKIQYMWDKLEDNFKCDTANFDVAQGSILKYAVKLRNFHFLNNAISQWKVNLNKVDNDGKTLMDYLSKEIERTKQSPELSGTLITYYEIARKAGAKHSREL